LWIEGEKGRKKLQRSMCGYQFFFVHTFEEVLKENARTWLLMTLEEELK
jgi:hypothetical protein